MSDFHTSQKVRARKEHRCPECREVIPIGATYVREVGRWDGDFYANLQCEACAAFAKRYLASLALDSCRNWDEVSYTFGDLINEALEFADGEFDAYRDLTLAQRRDAIPPLLDRFDAAERHHRAQERERRKQAAERQAAQLAVSLCRGDAA